QNIDEVLQYTPGINYNRPFGIFSTKATVTMRGLSGKEQARVLVLMDGIPLNKSDGGTVDWNMVDMNAVQKIEVIKGAGSALYGGNAMGGIINIITRRPDEKLSLNTSLEYGTFNTMGGRISAGKSSKPDKAGISRFWNANFFAKKSDGYITQSEADIAANPYIVKSNMKEAGSMVKGGLIFKNNHRLEASVNYYNDNRGTGEKVYQPDGNATDHDSYGITMNYQGRVKKTTLRSSVYMLTEDYKKVNEYLKDDYTWYNVLSVRRDLGWINSATFSAGRIHKITAGFDIKNGSVDAYDEYYTSTDIVYNEGKILTSAVFAQDEMVLPGDKIKLTAGLRYDVSHFYDGSFRIEAPTSETQFMQSYQVPEMKSQTWRALSPRFSAQYKWNEDSRVYAQVSRGFRASALEDLCRSGRIKGGFKIANPSLNPEYLTNIETGADVLILSKIQLSASVYFSQGKDFQYYITNGQTIDMGFGERPIMLRSNISKVKIFGAETELRYNLSEKISAFANYTYTHSVIGSYTKLTVTDTIDLSGNFLTDVPRHMANAGVTFRSKFVNASASVRYTGSQYVNDQNIW
ncbi:MAG TPA: TonB-dependent receptor, partial [Bacteroidales bacterium]|nr:TonB-dependent receptor [Bacteroidales bacterium]